MSKEVKTQTEVSVEVLLPTEKWPQHWPSWVREVTAKMEEVEETVQAWKPEGTPEWALKMWLELMKVASPTVKPNDYDESGPRFLGAMLGNQKQLISGENGLPKQFERLEVAIKRADEELKRKLNAVAYARLVEKQKKYNRDLEIFWFIRRVAS